MSVKKDGEQPAFSQKTQKNHCDTFQKSSSSYEKHHRVS